MTREGAQAEAIDRLYGLPLDEFTAARDELAGRFREEGDRDAASEVKRLRKPNVVAWALNQVRRSNAAQVEELIATGERLREAQERLLEGGGRKALDQAAAEERRLIAELTRQAERELVATGRAVGDSIQERLRSTLHAVATDPEAREGLRAGRLLRDHAPSGLGPLLEAAPARRGGKDGDRQLERRARQLEGRLEQARAKQRELEEELSKAVRELREARREAARVASALERAEAAEEQARAQAKRTGERTAELERELRELQPGR